MPTDDLTITILVFAAESIFRNDNYKTWNKNVTIADEALGSRF
jgi:hypothetical protein